MNKPAFEPVKGERPNLQFLKPKKLQVDPSYQRDTQAHGSQALIRTIAYTWDWSMCLPLVVAQRPTGEFFVIDGQHRWEAARLRNDIEHLPCLIVRCKTVEDEAALFVSLNQRRRALSALEVFKAAVASGDAQASAIVKAMETAGLTLATHSNHTSWEPGMVSNIGGIQRAWKTHGPGITSEAFQVLAQACSGQVLRYAGTLFPGIVAICAHEFGNSNRAKIVKLVASRGQERWRSAVLQARVDDPNLNFDRAAARVLLQAWGVTDAPKVDVALDEAAFDAGVDGKAWCGQCDGLQTRSAAMACQSKFCKLKG